MVGNAATIKIGSDVAGALAGLTAIQMGLKNVDRTVVASAALVRKASLIMTAAFVGVGAIGVYGLSKGIKSATDNFREFEQSAVNAASVSGETGDAFIAIKENVMDMSKALGRETMFTAGVTAEALYDVASAGYDVGNMVKNEFKPVMDLAAGTQSELARTTHWVTSVLGQFNLGMEDSGRVADVFALTIASSKATLEKMGLAFNYAGSAAYAFGDDIESVGAILALMYNRGLRGEQAGRALASAYADLADPTAKALGVIKELGLTADEVNPKFHSMAVILGRFAAAGMDANQAFKIFGKESAKGTLAALQGMDMFLILNTKLLNSTGFAALLAAEQLDTLKGSTNIFHSALEVLSIEIGEFFGYFLKGMNLKLIEMVNVMINKVEPALDALRKILVDMGPAFTGAKIAAEKFRGILSDIGFILGFSRDSFDNFVDKLNLVVVSIAWMLKYIDEHPSITKFALAIGFVAISFSILLPIVGAVSYALAGLASYLTLLTMLTAGGALAAIGASLAALFSPIIVLTLLISILAAAWIFNIGGMREFTSAAVDVMVDDFWWMIDKLMGAVNYIVEKTNEIRTALGFEPIIPMVYDADKSREAFRQMGRDIETIKAGAQTGDVFGGMFDEDYVNFFDVYLDSMQQSIDYQAEQGEEYMKSKSALDSYNDSRREAIIILDSYATSAERASRFDIGGMSAEKAGRTMPRMGAFADTDVGREAGRIAEVRTTTINIENVNTKADVDSGLDEITDAAEAVGP